MKFFFVAEDDGKLMKLLELKNGSLTINEVMSELLLDFDSFTIEQKFAFLKALQKADDRDEALCFKYILNMGLRLRKFGVSLFDDNNKAKTFDRVLEEIKNVLSAKGESV